ncbi:MAG: PIN domain-containing protein, partial [Caecibacter massiliensis]|nr:PIN domain-containing protein [Caecibacter massiliensis]
MAKTYVLDTNVLIQAPYALQCFEENHLVLPLVVLEELDGLKKAEGERGYNARQAIRILERLRLSGDLLTGVSLPNGGTLRIETNCIHEELPDSLPDDRSDNRILKVCCHLRSLEPILVTKNLLLRLKAQVLRIEAQDFSTEQINVRQQPYLGRSDWYVAEDAFASFRADGIDPAALYQLGPDGHPRHPSLYENEFLLLRADASRNKTHLGCVRHGRAVPLLYADAAPYGVRPRNAGQYFLQEALMRPADEAPLVIVKGQAGTAKTFYSLAV